jgi:putative tributyrin esterase
MGRSWVGWIRLVAVSGAALLLASCGRNGDAGKENAPSTRLPVGTVLRDRTFRSEALGREVTYRVIEPVRFEPGRRLRVLYLRHGSGGTYRDWSTSSGIAPRAAKGYVLVMPDGGSSYWMNSVGRPADRYEDFVTGDLVRDAERGLPGAVAARDRAIAGISMGGFAALVLSARHPELYGFVGALSPAVDVAERGFSWRRPGQSWSMRRIFGPMGSAARAAEDPFVLWGRPGLPFLFLSSGRDEPLAVPVLRFDRVLQVRGVAHAYRTEQGGHDWGQWNLEVPGMVAAMESR